MGKETKNIRFYFIILSVFSVFMLILTVFGDPGILALRKLTRKHEVLMYDIASIQLENTTLRDDIERLRTSKHYIEELARKEYGMVKDSEIVFLFQN